MNRTISRIILLIFALSAGSSGQSFIRTVLGGAPDGVAAVTATVNNPMAVAGDLNGDIYASLQGTNQVIKITPDGLAVVVAGTGTAGFSGDGGPARAAMLSAPLGLTLDSAGNLYIADSKNNRIRRVGTDGVITTVAGNGTSGYTGDGGPALAATLKTPSVVALDLNGNLLIADSLNHLIRKLTLDGKISTIAGVGKKSYGGDEALATAAGLDTPSGIAVDGAGNVYIADTGNDEIRTISPDGIIHKFAGKGTAGYYGDGGYASQAYINNPTGLAFDKAGTLYFVDQGNIRIRRITRDGKISTFAGTGIKGAAGDGGLARTATLNTQTLAVDRNNNIFLAEGTSNRVRIITIANGIIDTLAGNGLASYNLRGMAVSGNIVYFSDGDNNRVRRFDLATSTLAVIAGDGQSTYAGDGDTAATASLHAPRGLTLDSSGRLYIADSANERVRRIGTDGIITTVAGTGTATSTGDGATAASATINEPVDVALDASGNLFIAEKSGEYVRKVSQGGTITSVVGTGIPGSGTGAGVATRLHSPQGLLAEPSGSLLIADTSNHRVLRLATDGSVSIVAGGNGQAYGGDGGPAALSMLNNPIGLARDGAGNIYIADSGNHALRQIGADGIIATVAGLATSSGTRIGAYNGDGSPATAYALNSPYGVAPGPDCTMLISDMANQRLRRLWLGVDYTITTNPSGLKAIVDGQTIATPAVLNWLPGTQHKVEAPASQDGETGTKYLGSASQDIAVSCGAPRASVSLSLHAQYLLTATAATGGTVSITGGWLDAGAQVTLTATPSAGFVFAGWEGDCTGTGSCTLVMNGPKTVKADFTAVRGGAAPSIYEGGVISASGFYGQKSAAPGSWVEIYGTNLSPVTAEWSSSDFTNGTAPQKIAGVSVTIAGQTAFLRYISPGQINVQIPDGIGTGSVPVVVTNANGSSAAVNLIASAAVPGLDAIGQGYVAAFMGSAIAGSPGYPAVKPGDVITLYGTGFGAVSPAVAAGKIAAGLTSLVGTLKLRIGGADATLTYQGLAPGYVGLYQFNLVVPDVSDGDQKLTIDLGGVSTGQDLSITLKR